MRRFSNAFGAAAKRVGAAAARTLADFHAGRLPDEPNFTSSFTSRAKDELDKFQTGGIFWQARILSPITQERQFGADFVGTLKLQLPGFSVMKGFLAQAKRQLKGAKLNANEWKRLVGQCETMLKYSSESFVFVYAAGEVITVPALSVIACAGPVDLYKLHPKPLIRFYRDHFKCWIGQALEAENLPAPWLPGDFTFQNGLEITGEATTARKK